MKNSGDSGPTSNASVSDDQSRLPPAVRRSLRTKLLRWFDVHRRDLPWRRTADAYQVWVAEIMLQQTLVKTVVPYYDAFVRRFPTPSALAVAPLDDVLARWSGLGYYRRARSLHAAARQVVTLHGGHFPRDIASAEALPGVGTYTARAVLSIAHGLPFPVVDGNVRRVLARLLLLRGQAWTRDAAFYGPAETLLVRRRPGDWNQALMELGAIVCTPANPTCDACPLSQHCRAREMGLVDRLPEQRARRPPRNVAVAAALIKRNGRVLLLRRQGGPLFEGLWEIPQTGFVFSGRPDVVGELERRHGMVVRTDGLLGFVRHTVTHHRIRAEVYGARLRRLPRRKDTYMWVRPDELGALPISSLTLKLLRATTRDNARGPNGHRPK